MLTAWLDQPSAVERLRAWSEIADLDLVRLGTIAEADEITDTAVTQPLVVAAALLAFEQMGVQPSDTVVAGHSVGELAAAAVAGVITADDAVRPALPASPAELSPLGAWLFTEYQRLIGVRRRNAWLTRATVQVLDKTNETISFRAFDGEHSLQTDLWLTPTPGVRVHSDGDELYSWMLK